MAIIVQKYGGSSVADATKLRRVAERIMKTKAAGYDVIVVVSAMGDSTDELLSLARQVSTNPDRRELDMLLSAGERISMALLSLAIRELGGDAISFTGSQSGIITNDRHIDARIIEVRPFRIQDELSRGRIVVVGALSIIGAGINTSHAKVRLGWQALRNAGIPVRSMATSSFRVTWTVPRQMTETGARVLHRVFLEDSVEPVP